MVMRLNNIFFVLLATVFSCDLVAKEIAITFDDAPRPATTLFDGPTRANRLIETLSSASVERVAFFVISSHLNDEGLMRIEKYASAGHIIGNHTHCHFDLNTTDTEAYIDDILTADHTLRNLPGFIRWFRYPMLREGSDLTKRDAVRDKLKLLGYSNAYITIDNYDWYMDFLLQKALQCGKKVDYSKLKEVYLEVLLACVEFYDEMAANVLGRSPAHIILLHENDLNALFVGDLVRELRDKGWKIISPEKAYEDEISQKVTERVLKYNPGRIGEIAKDSGYQEKLWHESCDEDFLEQLFTKRQVFY